MATRTNTTRKPAAKPANDVEYGEREDGSLSGNVTMEPELRFTPNGRAVAMVNVAVNERVKNEETGEWEDTDPEFFRINIWGDQAERAVECFNKGDRIVAVGYFQDRTYTGKDGERHTSTEFTARDIGPSLLFKDAMIKRPQRSSGKQR